MNRGTQIYVWLPSTPPTKNVILYYHLNSSFRISSASLISPIHGFSQKSFGTLPPFSTEFIPSDIAIARASSNTHHSMQPLIPPRLGTPGDQASGKTTLVFRCF
jgi:hypothetical protein